MSDIEIDANMNAPLLDEDTERKFRDLIILYCENLVARDWKKLEPYLQGVLWGAVTLLDAQGYGDWARSVVDEEMETYSRGLKGAKGPLGFLQSSAFDMKTTRILIPGNRHIAAVGR